MEGSAKVSTPSRSRAKRPHLTIDTLGSAAAAPSPARSVGAGSGGVAAAAAAASNGTPGVIPASPSTQASSRRGGKSPATASAITFEDGSQQRRKTSLQLDSQLIPPSPSRSRLDPQYSARLSAQQQGGAAGIGGGSLFNPPGIVRGYSSAASTPTGHAGHMSPFRPPAVSTASPRISHSEPASLYGTPVASGATFDGSAGTGSLYETPRRRPQSARALLRPLGRSLGRRRHRLVVALEATPAVRLVRLVHHLVTLLEGRSASPTSLVERPIRVTPIASFLLEWRRTCLFLYTKIRPQCGASDQTRQHPAVESPTMPPTPQWHERGRRAIQPHSNLS